MLINISNLSEGEKLDVDELFPAFKLEDCEVKDIRTIGNVINNAGRMELILSIGFLVSGYCARCGADFESSLETEVNEPISDDWLTNGSLELSEVVTSEISLALPLRFLCSPECLGLCGCCGANLNNAKCNCDIELLKKED